MNTNWKGQNWKDPEWWMNLAPSCYKFDKWWQRLLHVVLWVPWVVAYVLMIVVLMTLLVLALPIEYIVTGWK